MKKLDLKQIFLKKNDSTNINQQSIPDVKNESKKIIKNKYFSTSEFMIPPPAENLPIPNFDEE